MLSSGKIFPSNKYYVYRFIVVIMEIYVIIVLMVPLIGNIYICRGIYLTFF